MRKYVIPLLTGLGILFSLWSFRWVLFERFNLPYVQRYYEASQWHTPLSPRIMGDDLLYQYGGQMLAKGADPFTVDPEVPPLGKYIYGFSILWTGNPYFASIVFFILSAACFWRATLFLFEKHEDRWFAFGLFMMNPVVFFMVPRTLMDLPQMVFLLGHVVCLLVADRLKDRKRNLFVIVLSGVLLGLFAATKIGLIVPLVLVADAYLFWKKKQLKLLVVVVGVMIAIYVSIFMRYFLLGHSFLEFLRTQKWMITLYASTTLHFIPGMSFITLASGYFKGWWQNAQWERAVEWTALLPLSLAAFGLSIFQMAKRKKPQISYQWGYVYILLFFLLGVNAIIPFWPRYMVLLLPFLVLIFVKNFPIKMKLAREILFILLLIQSVVSIHLWKKHEIQEIGDKWQGGWYEELYQRLSDQTKRTIDSSTFVHTMTSVDRGVLSTTKVVQIQTEEPIFWKNAVDGNIAITYTSFLGDIPHTHVVRFVQNHGKWGLDWDWTYVLPDFSETAKIETRTQTLSGGILKTSDGVILSKSGERLFLSVVPEKLMNGEEFIAKAAELTGILGKDIRIAVRVHHFPEEVVPIGYIGDLKTKADIEEIKRIPGVVTTSQKTRVYNPSHIEKILDIKIQDEESRHPEVLGKIGGGITLRKPNGEAHILKVITPIAGHDVTSNKTLVEFLSE